MPSHIYLLLFVCCLVNTDSPSLNQSVVVQAPMCCASDLPRPPQFGVKFKCIVAHVGRLRQVLRRQMYRSVGRLMWWPQGLVGDVVQMRCWAKMGGQS